MKTAKERILLLGQKHTFKKNEETSHDVCVSQPSHKAVLSGEFHKFYGVAFETQAGDCLETSLHAVSCWTHKTASFRLCKSTRRRIYLSGPAKCIQIPHQHATSLHNKENKPPSSGVRRSSGRINTHGCVAAVPERALVIFGRKHVWCRGCAAGRSAIVI